MLINRQPHRRQLVLQSLQYVRSVLDEAKPQMSGAELAWARGADSHYKIDAFFR